ncbi:MAG: uroporphyrinogen decarboxylase family protein [Actinobacteria bacterium]|nr:uroporphyrinogen decarboxylase family protein [Actinomycetota bacterium]
MNSKIRIKKALNFNEADKVGIGDEFWVETTDRWLKEGMSKEIPLYEYFNFDYWWIMFDQRIGFDEYVIDENESYKIIQHIDGGIFKIPKNGRHFVTNDMDLPGIPIDFKIKKYEDWLKYKEKFVPDKWRLAFKPKISASFGTTQESLLKLKDFYKDILNKELFIFFAPREGVENMRTKLGTENFFIQIAANPRWIMEMFEADLYLTLEMYKMFENLNIKFDGAWVWGDIAYNKGSYFSQLTYKTILRPFHKKLFSFFREKNMPVVYHSDGKIDELLPLLVEDGITAIQPLEVKAGVDAVSIKKKYGRNLAIIGNIDAREIAKGKDEIETEIRSKIPFLKKGGGYIYHSDHSIPPDVSLNNYKFLLDCVKKYGSY